MLANHEIANNRKEKLDNSLEKWQPEVWETEDKFQAMLANLKEEVPDQSELSCLRKALFFEVRKDMKEEMSVVANVIFNRIEHKQYPNTICEVVLQKGQFEYVMRGLHSKQAVDMTISKNPIEKKSWETAKLVAEEFLLSKNRKDITKGAIAYHANTMRKPNSKFWQKLSKTKKTALHTFYSL